MLREPAPEAIIRSAHAGRELENNLKTQNDFVEVRRAESGASIAKVRPGMTVVRHKLDVIAMDVIVHAAPDRFKIVTYDLSGIEALVSCDKLEFFRNNKVTTLDVVTFGAKLRKARSYSRFVALA